MKVTVERAVLLKSLAHVHRIVERRNTVPILSNVLLRAEDGNLLLKATDLDLEIIERLAADVGISGATTVPAHILYEIVRELPDGAQVSLESNDKSGQLQLRSGRSWFNLEALPSRKLPDIATGKLSHAFNIDAGDLKRMIDKTQFAISNDETRYYLNGIFLHILDVEGHMMLRAVAADGHRMALIEIPSPDGAIGMPGVIVPRKAVSEVQKLCAEFNKVRIEISELNGKHPLGRFTFGDAGPTLTVKLIDHQFPDYIRVIPSANDKRLFVDRAAFTSAVRRVSRLTLSDGWKPKSPMELKPICHVKFTVADAKLTLSVTNPDSGSATEELDVDYDSSPIDIGFNARYILDITEQLDGDTMLFKLAEPHSPVLVSDVNNTNPLYVLMPTRI